MLDRRLDGGLEAEARHDADGGAALGTERLGETVNQPAHHPAIAVQLAQACLHLLLARQHHHCMVKPTMLPRTAPRPPLNARFWAHLYAGTPTSSGQSQRNLLSC